TTPSAWVVIAGPIYARSPTRWRQAVTPPSPFRCEKRLALIDLGAPLHRRLKKEAGWPASGHPALRSGKPGAPDVLVGVDPLPGHFCRLPLLGLHGRQHR